MRSKAERVAKIYRFNDDEHQARWISRWAENLAACSCSICGNPRRHLGNSRNSKTLAELRCDEQ